MVGPSLMLFAMGGGIAMPALQSLSTDTVGEELRGAVLGLYQSASSLATIVGSGLSGALYAVSAPLPFVLSGGLSLVVILPALYLTRALRKSSDVPQTVKG
jgi:MFS family permease